MARIDVIAPTGNFSIDVEPPHVPLMGLGLIETSWWRRTIAPHLDEPTRVFAQFATGPQAGEFIDTIIDPEDVNLSDEEVFGD